jgi:hypothetical protein
MCFDGSSVQRIELSTGQGINRNIFLYKKINFTPFMS